MAGNTADLGFNVFALDKASKTFIQLATKVERLTEKLDKLDRKDVDVEVKVDTDKGLAKVKNFAGSTSGVMSGAMKIVSANAIVMAAIVVAAIAASPFAAMVAAAGIVTAFGGGFAAIGIMAAAGNKKVKAEFSDLAKDVKKSLAEISGPFRSALMDIAGIARETFDSFEPHLKKAFEKMAPTISGFTDFLGEGLEELATAVGPLTEAFDAILRQLGPQMKPLFKDIADALKDLSETVIENKEEFGAFLGFLLRLIPLAIRIIDNLAKAGAFIIRNAPLWAAAFVGAIGFMVSATQALVLGVIDGVADMLRAFANLPGPIGENARKALGHVEEFRGQVKRKFDSAIGTLDSWETSLRNMPKELKLRGDIRDLQGKIATAKARLRDPGLTKPEKSKIRANIEDLKAQVRRAKDELRSIRDRTVSLTVRRTILTRNEVFGQGPGFARGTRSAPPGFALVGEEGPELVRFRGGERVFTARETARLVQDARGQLDGRAAAAAPSGGSGTTTVERLLGRIVDAIENGESRVVLDTGVLAGEVTRRQRADARGHRVAAGTAGWR